MSLYMSSHRKRKTFPYPYFGYAAIVSALVLMIYALSSDVPFLDILNGSLKDHLPMENGIAATVLPVLTGIMGLGVLAALKANFKAITYLLHFAFFILLSVLGFLNGDSPHDILPSLTAAAGVLYFLALCIYIFLFNGSDSKYSSIVAAVITVLPLIPLSFGFYVAAAGPSSVFNIEAAYFVKIINIAFIISMFLYTVSNSVYLEYVNRKASHR